MDLSDEAIKEYLLTSCSNNYFTPEVIAGFAKIKVFQEKTPSIEGWQDVKERNNLLSELKEQFSLKKIEPILEKLAEENSLEKDTRQVHKGRKLIDQTVYCLPANQ